MIDNTTSEALVITQEECAEVIQAISKVFRFGEQSNREHLEEEVGQTLALFDILIERCILSDSNVNAARIAKKEKLKQWSNLFSYEQFK